MKRITFIKSIRVFSVSLIGFLFLCGTAFAVTNNLFSEFQSISTDGAHDWESFIIAGDTYLVVANHEKSGYGTANNSWIYKWNGTFFEEFQPIPTLGAMDWEAFTIAGETFIAVANTNDGPNLDVDSKIYKWNGTSFVEFQSIPTDGGWDWEAFTIAGENFLAIANYYKASTHNVDSRIYKWDENVPAFVEIQAIPTIGAHDWESFDIDGDTYLAVAHFADGSNHNLDSKIFKWNGTFFEEFQSIPTSGAWDWESFSIAGDMYLAVANTNSGDGSNYNVDSRIYKWNGTSFEEFQTIPTNGALDWESFAMAGNSYLVVANYTNNSTNNVDSHIYEWNGTFFEEFQSILTNGAREWESFKIGGKTYLAVANNGNTTHYYIADSKIYKIDLADEVEIDIIPKTCPNECPIKGSRSVEVAILGTADFDVNDIDIASVRLEGVAPTRSSLKDKSSPVVDPQTECECTTDGRDGFLDLCLKFDKKAIMSALGGVNVDQEYPLSLSGQLNDGTQIEGQDCIVFVKKGKKD